MRWPVNFDNQASRQAHKVDDIATDAVLSAKPTAVDSLGTGLLPEPMLRTSLVFTQELDA